MQVQQLGCFSHSVPMGCLSPYPSRTEQRPSWLLPDVLLSATCGVGGAASSQGVAASNPRGVALVHQGALVLGKPLHRAAGHRLRGFVLAWQP